MPPEENLQTRHGLPAVEAAARGALNLRVGRILSDAEWARARHNLLEVAGILRDWEQRAIANQREGGAAEQQDKAA